MSEPAALPLLRFPTGDIQLRSAPWLTLLCGGAPSPVYGDPACARLTRQDVEDASGVPRMREASMGWSFSLSSTVSLAEVALRLNNLSVLSAVAPHGSGCDSEMGELHCKERRCT